MGLKRWPLNITLDEGHQDDAGKVFYDCKGKGDLALPGEEGLGRWYFEDEVPGAAWFRH